MNSLTSIDFFKCCIMQPQPQRRIIDRSMIGMPTNFQHTAHIGSNDFTDPSNNNAMEGVQTQMQTKGGYSGQLPPLAHLKLIDVQPHNMQAVSS